MSDSDKSILQLTETVSALAMMVEKNESRYISIEKSFRWFAVAFLCLTMLVFFIGFNMTTKVHAGITDAFNDMGTIVEDTASIERYIISFFKKSDVAEPAELLDKQHIVSFFKNMNTLIHNAAILSSKVEHLTREPLLSNLQNYGKKISDRFEQLDNKLKQETSDKNTAGVGMGDVLVDALVLIHRLKLDSDSLRSRLNVSDGSGLFNRSEISRVLQGELRLINNTLSVMTHSMGPTMGRMGTMMNNTPIMNTIPW
ncbi:hypothetical protein QUF74_15755 [Candidatus Halobeggiatoa sp. HSG11]|nr:hypothetical protein [Candidatus Halobeggiatoa sp. HSG11]